MTTMQYDQRLIAEVQQQPYPLLFVTISGAHLYGFPSPDSDYDLRGVLEEAFQASPLPEAPTNRAALNDLLLRLRLQYTNGEEKIL